MYCIVRLEGREVEKVKRFLRCSFSQIVGGSDDVAGVGGRSSLLCFSFGTPFPPTVVNYPLFFHLSERPIAPTEGL